MQCGQRATERGTVTRARELKSFQYEDRHATDCELSDHLRHADRVRRSQCAESVRFCVEH